MPEPEDDTVRCLTCGLVVERTPVTTVPGFVVWEWVHENGSRFCSIDGQPGESLAWPATEVDA